MFLPRSYYTVLLCVIVFAFPAVGVGQTFVGQAEVTDGDTLRMGEARIRLHGMDAPEGEQPCFDADGTAFRCGVLARAALEHLVKAKTVSCYVRDTDRYGRIVATCLVDDKDIAEVMVRAGYGFAFRRYSNACVTVERDARRSGRGLWASRFQYPWDWRKAQK